MASAPGVRPPVNGIAYTERELKEILEYEKILNIRDEIFAGTHPRLKIPASALPKGPSYPSQAPHMPAVQSHAPQSMNGNTPLRNDVQVKNGIAAQANGLLTALPNKQRPPITKASSSEIDPIFLTKSDVLYRSELQLKRQKIERSLKDQVELKRFQSRQDTALAEANPDFVVSDVLAKALDLVKPFVPSRVPRANGNSAASDSFDENDLYSSKAGDSTTDTGEIRQRSRSIEQHAAQRTEIDSQGADADADLYAEAAGREVDTGRRSPSAGQHYSPALQPVEQERKGGVRHEVLGSHANGKQSIQQEVDEPYEDHYSPPAAEELGGRQTAYPPGPPRGGNLISYPGTHAPLGRAYSPREEGRIVRNHITSPAAPQPERLSPLALAKPPPFTLERRRDTNHGNQRAHGGQRSGNTSPEITTGLNNNRKRKKNQQERKQNKRRNVSGKATVPSPEPAIKAEPMSPPPFSQVPAFTPAERRRAAERPIYIDDNSPREIRYPASGNRRIEAPTRYVYDAENPPSPGIVRTSSGMALRRQPRDEPDLRRVASFQHARQPPPEPNVEYVMGPPPARSRAASHALVERPMPPPERIRYYDEPIQDSSRRYVRAERSLSPGARYEPAEAQSRMMAPPQKRRIVVDEHGNEYYETPATTSTKRVHQSVAPTSRLSESEAHYDRPQYREQPRLRAVSVVEDEYGRRHYVEEMPPPPVYHRVIDTRATPMPQSMYERPEYAERAPPMRSASVQIVDYPPPRQATYVDEHAVSREYSRMASVQPPNVRYGEIPRNVERVGSVRPEARQQIVYIDDEPRRVQDYMTVERPGYGYAAQPREERYY